MTMPDVTTTTDSPTTVDAPMGVDTSIPDTGVDTSLPDTGHDTSTGTCTAVSIPAAPMMVTACPTPDKTAPARQQGSRASARSLPTLPAMPGACTAAHIQTIYNDCFGATRAAQTACDNDANGATANCFNCINSNERSDDGRSGGLS